jgi:imidazole glycerol phosphate synthase glutamine amidotransferase subunit
MIGIVDYGAGNLRSVIKAFDFLGFKSRLVDRAAALDGAELLVLPGVGAFGEAARQLKASGLFDPIRDWLRDDRPFLGICLGLQLLFESSEESPEEKGFAAVRGTCRRLAARKVPQIGWNTVRQTVGGPAAPPLFRGFPDGSYFYFVHSFYVAPEDPGLIAATTDYEGAYPSVVARGRTWGVQFHPEKSGELGLRLLSNWVRQC